MGASPTIWWLILVMVMPKTSIDIGAHENFLRRSLEFRGILPKLPNIPLPKVTVIYLLIFDALHLSSEHFCRQSILVWKMRIMTKLCRIFDISLYSNKIKIGRLHSLKTHQMVLGMVLNKPNQKTNPLLNPILYNKQLCFEVFHSKWP